MSLHAKAKCLRLRTRICVGARRFFLRLRAASRCARGSPGSRVVPVELLCGGGRLLSLLGGTRARTAEQTRFPPTRSLINKGEAVRAPGRHAEKTRAGSGGRGRGRQTEDEDGSGSRRDCREDHGLRPLRQVFHHCPLGLFCSVNVPLSCLHPPQFPKAVNKTCCMQPCGPPSQPREGRLRV